MKFVFDDGLIIDLVMDQIQKLCSDKEAAILSEDWFEALGDFLFEQIDEDHAEILECNGNNRWLYERLVGI